MKDDRRKMFVRLAYAAPPVCVLVALTIDWFDRLLGYNSPLELIGFLVLLGSVAAFLSSYAFLVAARANWLNYLWISFIWWLMVSGTMTFIEWTHH